MGIWAACMSQDPTPWLFRGFLELRAVVLLCRVLCSAETTAYSCPGFLGTLKRGTRICRPNTVLGGSRVLLRFPPGFHFLFPFIALPNRGGSKALLRIPPFWWSSGCILAVLSEASLIFEDPRDRLRGIVLWRLSGYRDSWPGF